MGVSLTFEPLLRISAIYFGLLRGYDYYAAEKDAETVSALEGFKSDAPVGAFFARAKQDVCAEYPYWPRAFLLETASFFCGADGGFTDFDALRRRIASFTNISDRERGEDFLSWLREFPSELAAIEKSEGFRAYLRWERGWTTRQEETHRDGLALCAEVLDFFGEHYDAGVETVSVVLNPIKCAYAADYFRADGKLFYISGRFLPAGVVHEFLHPIVRSFIDMNRETVLQSAAPMSGIDTSYLLDGSELGLLNAREEQAVRRLTDAVMAGVRPARLDEFVF